MSTETCGYIIVYSPSWVQIIFLWLNISKRASCGKTWFWGWWCKVKIFQNMVPHGQLWDSIIYIGFFNTNLLSCLKDLMKKQCLHVWTLNCYCTSTLCTASSQTLRTFSQNQLFTDLLLCHQWNYHISGTQCLIP